MTEPTKAQVRKWRRYLADERIEAQTYLNLAERRTGQQREIMLGLAAAEQRHEQHWLDLLGDRANPPPKPRLHARFLPMLARLFGTVFVFALAQRSEQRTAYDKDEDAPRQMAADEHIHEEVIRSLAAESRSHMAGSFRAAIFGANDGLISNLALILGVAAAGMENSLVLMTGFAGLLAGALSMAAGEWISVSSQRELLDASTPDPEAHRSVPALDVNANELALLFRARGEMPEDAERHAQEVFEALGKPTITSSGSIRLRSALTDGMSNTSEAVGTPLKAALSSFVFFAIGAIVPLVPFIFGLDDFVAIFVSSAVVGVVLLMTGGLVGLLSGKPAWRGAIRQLLIGFAAAGTTYGLGWIFGVATA